MIISGTMLAGSRTDAGLNVGDVVLSTKETLDKDGKRYRLLTADGNFRVSNYSYPELAESLGYGKSICKSKPGGLAASWGSSLTYSGRELFTVQDSTDGSGKVLYASADLAAKWELRGGLLPAVASGHRISLASNGKAQSEAALYFTVDGEFGTTDQLFKSVDKGLTWTPLWTNDQEQKIYSDSLAAAGNLIGFITMEWSETVQHFIYSIDGGSTWNKRKILDGQGWFTRVAICQNTNTFYLANSSKCIKHKAGSGIFTETTIPFANLGNVYGVSVDEYEQMLLLGTDAGLVYSGDGGVTFTHLPDAGYVNKLITDGYRRFYATGWDGFYSFEPVVTPEGLELKKVMLSELPEQGESMSWASGDAIVYWTTGDEGTVKVLSGLSDGMVLIPDVGFGGIGKIVASIEKI